MSGAVSSAFQRELCSTLLGLKRNLVFPHLLDQLPPKVLPTVSRKNPGGHQWGQLKDLLLRRVRLGEWSGKNRFSGVQHVMVHTKQTCREGQSSRVILAY